MIKAGTEVPEYQNAAHHIVAGGEKKAVQARAVLNKYVLLLLKKEEWRNVFHWAITIGDIKI